jgi:CMP-N-acetylneuraminic acid synthetase
VIDSFATTAFLPCRRGSERIPLKNTKKFANVENGLLEIKLKQLEQAQHIVKILLSTNDETVIEIANKLNFKKLQIDRRPDTLCLSSTSTDELINYVPSLNVDGPILWTHVTSPFVGPVLYDRAIEEYFSSVAKKQHDSLMSVTPHRSFFWNQAGPISYDRTIEKWPRTQTIEPIYEVNSAIFLADASIYRSQHDRIGDKPRLFALKGHETIDIDWPGDFQYAEFIWQSLAE